MIIVTYTKYKIFYCVDGTFFNDVMDIIDYNSFEIFDYSEKIDYIYGIPVQSNKIGVEIKNFRNF